MIKKAKKEAGRVLTAIVITALSTVNCTKEGNNNPADVDINPNYKDAIISMNIAENVDSSYIDVKIYSSDPCSVGVEVLNGDSILQSKRDYVIDSIIRRFSGLPKPLDGSVKAYNNNTIWGYFQFPDAEPNGDSTTIIDTNGISISDSSDILDTINSNTVILDSNTVIPDSNTIIPDSNNTITDSLDNNQKDLFDSTTVRRRKQFTKINPVRYANRKFHNPKPFYKSRQFTRV